MSGAQAIVMSHVCVHNEGQEPAIPDRTPLLHQRTVAPVNSVSFHLCVCHPSAAKDRVGQFWGEKKKKSLLDPFLRNNH